MATTDRGIHPEVPGVVSVRRQDPSSHMPLLRRSALPERMAAARAEGKRVTEFSLREQAGMPGTSRDRADVVNALRAEGGAGSTLASESR